MSLLCRLFLLALLLGAADCHADRDIVYSARYYAPPGSHRTSHFHLYRINPDGTGRRQLTFGASDDADPHWSPDGRKVVFLRGAASVCVADADGSGLRRITDFAPIDTVASPRWLPDGRTVAFVHYGQNAHRESQSALWVLDVVTRQARCYHVTTDYGVSPAYDYAASPDGQAFLVRSWTGDGIVNRRTGALILPPEFIRQGAWLGNDLLVGHSYEMPLTLRFYGREGDREERRVTMFPPVPDLWDQDMMRGGGWLQPSPHSGTVVYALNEHNSTVGARAAFFRVSLSDGGMHFLAEGQFLTWSPDGSRFCTAPGRDTWTYPEKRGDGAYKTVWAAPLLVSAYSYGKLKTITPGLVWVVGADWRKVVP